MILLQTSIFKRLYKKLNDKQKIAVNTEIEKIIDTPAIGEQKKQDLSDVYIHKFKINKQLYLLAYMYDPQTLKLIFLGVHENFYRDLKKSLK